MRSVKRSKLASALVAVTALSVLMATGTAANASVKTVHAATKTIICYKGTAVKKVTAAKPKCAVGWTTKKPVAKKTALKAHAFSGSYKGTIALLWSDSNVKATSVTGTGTGNILGFTTMTGTGSSSPTDTCAPIFGSGVLSGGGNTLKVTFNPSSKGCADGSAAPTNVNISGTAVITGGTGKYVGATGNLKFLGFFGIKSTSAGTSENTAFNMTVSGSVNTK